MNELKELEFTDIEYSAPEPLLRPQRHYEIALLLVAVIVFFGCIISPPGLMDDVDAVHGQMARNMIDSHDWVIPHLDGVPYIEKAPLPYWLIAIAYLIFGVHDWVARIPTALAAVLLCLATMRYGAWAFGRRAGFYAGLVLATCVGLFLFTRILIPDVMLTLTICVCFMAFQRALNEDGEERNPRLWPLIFGASLGIGVLLKGLLAMVVPFGAIFVYLLLTRQFFSRETWRRLRPSFFTRPCGKRRPCKTDPHVCSRTKSRLHRRSMASARSGCRDSGRCRRTPSFLFRRRSSGGWCRAD